MRRGVGKKTYSMFERRYPAARPRGKDVVIGIVEETHGTRKGIEELAPELEAVPRRASWNTRETIFEGNGCGEGDLFARRPGCDLGG